MPCFVRCEQHVVDSRHVNALKEFRDRVLARCQRSLLLLGFPHEWIARCLRTVPSDEGTLDGSSLGHR
jgi:hypothetical protein